MFSPYPFPILQFYRFYHSVALVSFTILPFACIFGPVGFNIFTISAPVGLTDLAFFAYLPRHRKWFCHFAICINFGPACFNILPFRWPPTGFTIVPFTTFTSIGRLVSLVSLRSLVTSVIPAGPPSLAMLGALVGIAILYILVFLAKLGSLRAHAATVTRPIIISLICLGPGFGSGRPEPNPNPNL